jgi:hypothetical protein
MLACALDAQGWEHGEPGEPGEPGDLRARAGRPRLGDTAKQVTSAPALCPWPSGTATALTL